MQPHSLNATTNPWKYKESKVNSSVSSPFSIADRVTSDTPHTQYVILFDNTLDEKLLSIEKRLELLQLNYRTSISVYRLLRYNLTRPLEFIVEPDDAGFIARSPDLPLFGYGDDMIEAIDTLKFEIESVYDDLAEDDNFTDEWLQIKALLLQLIIR